jgi:signal transduction histidine kinase/CheY-like chemotaxis protein
MQRQMTLLLSNMSIRSKAIAAFVAVAITTAGLGAFAVSRLGNVNSSAAEIRNNWLPATGWLGTISTCLELYRQLEAAHVLANSVSEMEHEEAVMQERLQAFDETWRLYEATVTTPEEKTIISAFKEAWAKYQKESARLIALSRQDKAAATSFFTGSLRDDFLKVRIALEDALAFNVLAGRTEADRGSAVYQSARLLIWGAIAFALLICAAAGWMIIAGISQPIAQMTAAMKRLAGRDITVEIPGLDRKDEIGGMASAMQVFKDSFLRIANMEAEQKALNLMLEHQVAERTAALQASESRLRAIFETSYQYQGFMALDGTLLDANAPSLSGINATLANVVGKPFWDTPWFTGTAGMPEAVREAVAVVAQGQTVRKEIFVNLPTGWRWFDFTMRPMRNERGEVVGIVPEAVETTERRKAEEALRHSQKLDAMGELTGGVAHDFNNLLTPIIGGLDMLQRRDLGEREQRLIKGALRAADRAKILVQRLLAFARRQPLQPTSVDVGTLVRGMADLVSSTIGRQIKVVVEVADCLPPAKADPSQLEMAILNLAVNARDAMPKGGTLRISATSETTGSNQQPPNLEPGSYIRLSVTDTGIGMDAATLARAIEPFFSTKGPGRGTGLGLSMVHGLASQLGGALALSSEPGAGTTVDVWLPISEEPIAASEKTPDVIPASKAVGRVLLVDDDNSVRMSTADMLTELGYEVFEATSAEKGLRLFHQGIQIDLLITDHLMPGMTGVELAREIQEKWPDTPILIISGYAEAEGIAPDLPRLSKPFRQPELAASIAKISIRRS